MKLQSLLDNVHDEASFIVFVKALIRDREDELEKEKENPSSAYAPGANGWENGTIENYLDAAVAWAEDTNWGEKVGIKDINFWQKMAYFLYLGKIYE